MFPKTRKKRLAIIDTHALIHRGYHALPPLRTNDGVPTGALYGLISMILKFVEELEPDFIVACYDLPGGTFRTEMTSEYKAKRKQIDDDLISQIENSKNLLDAFSIDRIEAPGFEADDLIGTIATHAVLDEDLEVVIITGDSDTLQLVEKDYLRVFMPRRGFSDTILYDENEVINKYGFHPALLPDYKGLAGDQSDNIVGVKGVGEKTATALIVGLGSLEEIFATLKESKEKLKEKTGVKDRIVELLVENEDEAMFSKALGQIVKNVLIEMPDFKVLWRQKFDINRAIKECEKLEFNSLVFRVKKVFGEGGVSEKIEKVEKGELVLSQLERMILEAGIWLLNPEKGIPKDLTSHQIMKGVTDFNTGREKILELLKEANLEKIFLNIEEPVVPISERMSEIGIKIDGEKLSKLKVELDETLKTLESEIFALANTEINLRSPKQVSTMLFTDLKLEPKSKKKREGGAFSTDQETLESMVDMHPVVSKLLKFRELEKLSSTYVKPFEILASAGVINSHFLPHGTSTGRFSSENPNMQNIPIRGDEGKKIRALFVARPGKVFLSADYSQIQLRIVAMLAKDRAMTEIFKSGRDIHTETAAKIFHVESDKVDKEMRRKAKVINFGILYGMGPRALSKEAGISNKEAEEYIAKYFAVYPGVKSYIDQTVESAKKTGFTETIFGRKRFISLIKASLPFLRSQGERIAMNAPIQGTEADIMKLAMIHIDRSLAKARLSEKAYFVLQIHDEFLLEVEEGILTDVAKIVESEMEQVLDKCYEPKETEVPVEATLYSGHSWGDLLPLP